MSPVKIAFVASGGAARGLAHLGVLKACEELGLVPELFVGTSAGALVGAFSPPSPPARTLTYDLLFTHFSANLTLDWGPAHAPSSQTALGWAGGEGHYGLVLVGDAHIGGGNSSHVCCDGYGGAAFPDAALGTVARVTHRDLIHALQRLQSPEGGSSGGVRGASVGAPSSFVFSRSRSSGESSASGSLAAWSRT